MVFILIMYETVTGLKVDNPKHRHHLYGFYFASSLLKQPAIEQTEMLLKSETVIGRNIPP